VKTNRFSRVLIFLPILCHEVLWLATGKNGVFGFGWLRKDIPRFTAGCFTGGTFYALKYMGMMLMNKSFMQIRGVK